MHITHEYIKSTNLKNHALCQTPWPIRPKVRGMYMHVRDKNACVRRYISISRSSDREESISSITTERTRHWQLWLPIPSIYILLKMYSFICTAILLKMVFVADFEQNFSNFENFWYTACQTWNSTEHAWNSDVGPERLECCMAYIYMPVHAENLARSTETLPKSVGLILVRILSRDRAELETYALIKAL